jgi:MFS-type transporter involved in bile tolerance (Atg22 family)
MFEIALGALKNSVNTIFRICQHFLAAVLSISDPVYLTSIISLEMPVVLGTVIMGEFSHNFL